MLAVISDIHLTDGTCGSSISGGAFSQFVATLKQQVEAASWRKLPNQDQGVFQPIERVDIVLLGDILDVIRSVRWEFTSARPWDSSDTFFETVQAITRAILQHNKPALDTLKRLKGRLKYQSSSDYSFYEAEVRIHYMVGNHDWFYHLEGEKWNALRREVVEAMGLSNNPNEPFPHVMEESAAISTLGQQHRVYLQHGDIHDEMNYQEKHGRNAASLGDAIVIETLNRFPGKVIKELELDPSSPLAKALNEADNIRPLLALPQYLTAVVDHFATPTQKKKILDLWSEVYKPFLDLKFVHDLDKPWRIDPVDMLQLFFNFQQLTPVIWQSEITRMMEKIIKEKSYAEYAAQDLEKYPNADIAIFGHTHHQEVVPISNQYERQRLYINSGTWRRVHQRGISPGKKFPFVHFHVMSLVFIYKDTERFGRRYETWQGTLG